MEDIAWRGGGGVTAGRRRAGATRGRSDPSFNFNAQQPPASMFVDRGRPQEALRTLFKVPTHLPFPPTYPSHPPIHLPTDYLPTHSTTKIFLHLPLFKLYPWEYLTRDELGPRLLSGGMRMVEPPWKMVLR
jgi:hypothetical protein